MGILSKLPNISTVTEGKLNDIGIETPEQLKKLGSKEAFLRIRGNDPSACLHMLYGLEGAVQGIRDTDLSEDIKQDLKRFFKTI